MKMIYLRWTPWQPKIGQVECRSVDVYEWKNTGRLCEMKLCTQEANSEKPAPVKVDERLTPIPTRRFWKFALEHTGTTTGDGWHAAHSQNSFSWTSFNTFLHTTTKNSTNGDQLCSTMLDTLAGLAGLAGLAVTDAYQWPGIFDSWRAAFCAPGTEV